MIIPKPVELKKINGNFQLSQDIVIFFQPECNYHAEYLRNLLKTATSFSLPKIRISEKTNLNQNSIALVLNREKSRFSRSEGYHLQINPNSILIEGWDEAGCFYGIQSLRQLLPIEIESPVVIEPFNWNIPCVDIIDYPRFSWRGFMLDETRHFFGKILVKRMIDLLALHKINHIHWHLSDDEGWRVESKIFPRLHEIASRRLLSKKFKETPNLDNPNWYGGYYTHNDIKELVDYARMHFIEVIPEIEMPGHATAPLIVYPEFSCATPPNLIPTIGQRNRHAYCAGYPKTYEFLQKIIKEIIDVFGCEKVHIGGDELPKNRWENCERCQRFMKQENIPDLDQLQVYFAAQMIKYLSSIKKTTIGWFDFSVDRLFDLNVDKDQLIFQFWVGSEKKMIDFVRKGGKAIVSNHRFLYLDYGYWKTPLQKAYKYEPIPKDLEPEYHQQVLGIESPIWTEWVPNWIRLDFQVFPRLCAYSETAWSLKENRNYSDFLGRLKRFLSRLDMKNIYYAPLKEATNSWKSRLIPKKRRGGW